MSDAYDDGERLKLWWKEHGKQVVIGTLIGLGGLIGVGTWNQHSATQQQQASSTYAQLMAHVEAKQHQQVITNADRLIEQFKKSGYAVMGSLFAAQSAVALGYFDDAITHLDWVVGNTLYPEIATMAKLRIARIQYHQKQFDEAEGTLDNISGDLMTGLRDELRADVYMQIGAYNEARGSYEDALEADDATSAFYRRVQIKLDSLPLTTVGTAKPAALGTESAGS